MVEHDSSSSSEELARAIADARAAWSGVVVSDEAFRSFLAEKLPPDAKLADVAVSDLYLACACAAADASAIDAFERRYFPEIGAVLARVRDASINADDVRQSLREKLFVRSAEGRPKIAEYAGRGALGSWFRVTTMRLVLNLVRGAKEIPIDGEALLALPGAAEDVELMQLKARYRAEFKLAFADAVEALSFRERNLLKYAFGDGLVSDEIAAIYGVHRTTVNRWIAELGRSLTREVRVAMSERLRIDRSELESILRLIQSRLDITIERHATT
jgi:RNA polymerase sigma-70 factor (ECF subfamily)